MKQGEAQQLKLFPFAREVPPDDPQVARVGAEQGGVWRGPGSSAACYLGLHYGSGRN